MGTVAEPLPVMESTLKSCGLESTEQNSRIPTRQTQNCDLFPCLHPHNYGMRNIDDRIASFAGFSGRVRATRRQLAEAGLYYIHIGDRTKCFYCDGGLENWESDDDPWTEHSKFYPQCEYLLSKKGVEFVANVRSRNPNPPAPVVHATTSSGVSVINMRNATIRVTGGNPGSPPARGPTFHQTIVGGNFVQEFTPGQVFTTRAQEATAPPGTTPEVRSLEERTNEAMRSELATTMVGFGFSEELVRRTLQMRLGQSFSNDVFPSASEFLDAIEASRRQSEASGENQAPEQEQMETEEAAAVGGRSSTAASSAQDRVQELIREKRCKICLDQDSSCVFEPCGHMCACLSCGTRLRECPICRRRISTILRVYTS